MGAVAIEPAVKTAGLNKQKVKDGLASAVRVSQQVFESLQQKQVLISVALVGLLVVSSIGVVVSAHKNRELFNTLSQLQGERDQYQREWSQLLLEQSALSAHSRVESLAAQRFGMVVPGKEDIVLVPLMAPVAGL
ncbi:cell division protein, FtsL-like protein [Marinobacter lipolyticus SM19]|uniref:Cell division protein FtsL n=1 Tax=Marinobacter lipolyticus SM19 TaxID=1318628 RepID=R8AYD9_9GAMM|nr:cell division protein FtsL [Marinobacter lipolyticus]EON91353.1 cell division protein, FtsL-like protein [Marinobacter lipolyticus SM19]